MAESRAHLEGRDEPERVLVRAAPKSRAVARPTPVREANLVDRPVPATLGPCCYGRNGADDEPALRHVALALPESVLPQCLPFPFTSAARAAAAFAASFGAVFATRSSRRSSSRLCSEVMRQPPVASQGPLRGSESRWSGSTGTSETRSSGSRARGRRHSAPWRTAGSRRTPSASPCGLGPGGRDSRPSRRASETRTGGSTPLEAGATS